jgi:hypothetical protein
MERRSIMVLDDAGNLLFVFSMMLRVVLLGPSSRGRSDPKTRMSLKDEIASVCVSRGREKYGR